MSVDSIFLKQCNLLVIIDKLLCGLNSKEDIFLEKHFEEFLTKAREAQNHVRWPMPIKAYSQRKHKFSLFIVLLALT